jgi:hypothetical protein
LEQRESRRDAKSCIGPRVCVNFDDGKQNFGNGPRRVVEEASEGVGVSKLSMVLKKHSPVMMVLHGCQLYGGLKKTLIEEVEIMVPGVVTLSPQTDAYFCASRKRGEGGIEKESASGVKAEVVVVGVPNPFVGPREKKGTSKGDRNRGRSHNGGARELEGVCSLLV